MAKAYYCEDYQNGYGKIEYFDNAGQAKAYFANEFQERFVDVRPHRVPWADEYGDEDNIPIEVKFAHGWWFECNTCGRHIDELEDFFENERGYCCKACECRTKKEAIAARPDKYKELTGKE